MKIATIAPGHNPVPWHTGIMKPGNLNINRKLQLVFALMGGAALLVYWKSWQDVSHLFYDIPSGFTMSLYIGQIVLEGIKKKREEYWWARVLLLLPMSIVPIGRVFFNWNISGHLTDILAAAVIQTMDKRLRILEKMGYWTPLPVIVYIRWFIFDTRSGTHWETFNALAVGFSIILCYRLIRKICDRNKG